MNYKGVGAKGMKDVAHTNKTKVSEKLAAQKKL